MLVPRIVLVLAAACLLACPTDPPVAPPDPTPAADPTLPAGPGESRAAVLPTDGVSFAASTWAGITAEARPGDLKLWNDRVRFVVRSQEGHGYVGIAGALIDADLVRPADELGRDTLEEAFLAFGIGRLASGDSVRVLNDGLDGAPAVVRVEGIDVPWQFIMGVVETDEPLTPALNLRVVTDYVLPADSYVLEIRTTLYNDTDELVRTNPLDGLISSGEDLFSFSAGEGLAPGDNEDPASVGTAGRNGEPAFTLFLPEGTLDRFGAADLLGGSGISLSTHGWYDIPAGTSAEILRYRALAPDPLGAEAARWDLQGVELVSVSGQVTEDGAPLAGARVHIVDDTVDPPRVLGFALTGADGSWSARIPPGQWTAWATAQSGDERVPLPGGAHRYAPFAHELVNARQLDALTGASPRTPLPVALGRTTPPSRPLDASVDGATVDFEVTPPGLLLLQIRDEDGAAIPGMAQLQTVGEVTSEVPEALREALGLPAISGRVLRAWTPGADLALELPAGTYELTAEAGPRRSRDVRQIELVAGGTSTQTVTLSTVVARDGWLSMDSHLHAAPSNDGELPMENRLIGCAAAGVDLPVTTDHDRQADYRPLATALGLDGVMTVIPGVEVSPPLRGHFNLFPIEPRGPSVINGGAPPWWTGYPDTDGLMAMMRQSAPDAALQVNHGRDGTSAMMNAASFDPSVSEPYRADFWSWDFDLVELINAGGVNNWVAPRQDWFSWLNTGRIKVPTGVSDSHGLSRICGYGRTEVFVDTADPSNVDVDAVRDALAAGHVVVSGAVTLRVTGDGGALPGDTITGGAVELVVSVRGPDHVVPDEVRLYRNGELIQTEAITGPSVGGLWWEGSFNDAPATDSWYVVEVQGTQALGAFWGGSVAYAITNAFFVDTDGDGWEAPGIP